MEKLNEHFEYRSSNRIMENSFTDQLYFFLSGKYRYQYGTGTYLT